MKNENNDTGSLMGLIIFTICLFVFMYTTDLDKFGKTVEKFFESDDPANFVMLVVVGFIIGGLLMMIEYGHKK